MFLGLVRVNVHGIQILLMIRGCQILIIIAIGQKIKIRKMKNAPTGTGCIPCKILFWKRNTEMEKHMDLKRICRKTAAYVRNALPAELAGAQVRTASLTYGQTGRMKCWAGHPPVDQSCRLPPRRSARQIQGWLRFRRRRSSSHHQ